MLRSLLVSSLIIAQDTSGVYFNNGQGHSWFVLINAQVTPGVFSN